MTVEQLAGRMLWCGWGEEPEPEPRALNDHARWLVEELQVGGVILFTRNLGAPEEIAALTAAVRAAAAEPPLVGIDQEGGRVCRLRLPGLTFVPNRELGALDQPERTRAAARAIGEQLAALGISANFAPVLDVNNNPLNPVIGDRSFGDDPELVARHGAAAAAGFRDAGLLPVVKHFPGHGDTSVDSHLELPLQPADRARLERLELVPFRAVLASFPAAEQPAVMSAHILFPALDAELPATLSPAVLEGLLRREMGFAGLVVTDCLEMRAIADRWGPEETAVRAVEAGADMLLVCHTRETQARMHAALCGAVRSGRIPEERLRQSGRRIEAARAGLRLPEPDPAAVGAERFRAIEARIAAECGAAGGASAGAPHN